jgi:hypothetical protein
VDDAIDQGWEPYFYEGEDGAWEVNEEYRGKTTFLDESTDPNSGEHLVLGIMVEDPGARNMEFCLTNVISYTCSIRDKAIGSRLCRKIRRKHHLGIRYM